MILKVKNSHNTEEDYYLNDNNKRDIKICLNDISNLIFYAKNVLKGEKELESEKKIVRLLDSDNIYELSINTMYIDDVGAKSTEEKFSFIIEIDYLSYLHLILNKHKHKKTKFKKEQFKFCDIKLDTKTSKRDQLVFSVLDDLKNFSSERTPIDDFLLRWKTYHEIALKELSTTKDNIKSIVNLQELRNNYQFWLSRIEDNKMYLPIKIEELSSLRSTSLIAYKIANNGKSLIPNDLLEDYINVSYKTLKNERLKDFIHTAVNEYNYKIESNIAEISFDSDGDCEKILNRMKDMNISKIAIKQNIIGEQAKLKRIISGIEKIMNYEDINHSLIGQIINNKLNDNYNYYPLEENINRIKKEYKHLNEEQVIVVDKILNMKDLFLVQGPPGTGKTEIISTIVKELDKQNKIVLLTSNVQEARKNIVDRIKGEKELIIKSYTNLKDTDKKHQKEILDNKLKYISNQINEKFTYNEEFIYTSNKYQKLLELLEAYKDKNKEIYNLIDNKEKILEIKNNKEKNVEKINKVIENFKNENNNIYQLIIKDDLENIDSNILVEYINIFLELFNQTKLPMYVEKINYSLKKQSEYQKIKLFNEKINYFDTYDANKALTNTLVGIDFIKEYIKSSKLKQRLFNMSNIFTTFSINNKTKKEFEEIILENEKIINNINYYPVIEEYKSLSISFINYLNKIIEQEHLEINRYIPIINDFDLQIEEEKTKNFNINNKIEKLERFLNEYKNIKETYPDEDLFYSYLNDLNNIVITGKNNPKSYYIESMLGEKDFDKIFQYDNTSNGTILSMSTNQVANYLKHTNVNFDYIIVDEASKCNFDDIIVSLARTKKMVLIGDYLQLDPPKEDNNSNNVLSDNQWNSIKLSNFSQLIRPIVEQKFNQENNYSHSNNIGILNKQYRMSKDIFEIIKSIYDSIDGFGIVDGKKETGKINPNLNYKNILSLQCDGLESTKDEEDTSRYNEKEISMVVEVMNYVLELKRTQSINNIKKIGIISFYKRQVTKINNRIGKIKEELQKHDVKVELGTVFNFQGREFDLVILSCVRTETINSFTEDIRLWNVGISRAKDKLITIGNFEKLNKLAELRALRNDKFESQEKKELAVVLEKIIPILYEKREKFSSIEDVVKTFLKGGNE